MIDVYRTRDGEADYAFDFEERTDGSVRIYIANQPPYGRPAAEHEAHWLSDERGRYICWTERLTTIEDAKTVAAAWANRTQRFRATGRFA